MPSFPGVSGVDTVADTRLKGGWIDAWEREDPETVGVTPAQLAQLVPHPLVQTARDSEWRNWNDEQLRANQRLATANLLDWSGNSSILPGDRYRTAEITNCGQRTTRQVATHADGHRH